MIDLSKLPAPEVIEPLDFETILASIKADLLALNPALNGALQLESEPLTQLLEVVAYRELLLRARINDAAKSTMLAYATGGDLDNLVALYGIARGAGETDLALRSRAQLSLEGFSVAGPAQAYRFHAISAAPEVRDVTVSSQAPGQVTLTILAHPTQSAPIGVPDAQLLAKVLSAVSADTVRPLCDRVWTEAPQVINYSVVASLICLPGPDTATALAAAQAAVSDYVAAQQYLGCDIAISGILAALHQPGVMRADLTSPAAHISVAPNQVAYCTAIAISLNGVAQ